MVATAGAMTIDVQFDKANKMYQPGETVSGTIELKRCNAPNLAYESVHMLA